MRYLEFINNMILPINNIMKILNSKLAYLRKLIKTQISVIFI